MERNDNREILVHVLQLSLKTSEKLEVRRVISHIPVKRSMITYFVLTKDEV